MVPIVMFKNVLFIFLSLNISLLNILNSTMQIVINTNVSQSMMYNKNRDFRWIFLMKAGLWLGDF